MNSKDYLNKQGINLGHENFNDEFKPIEPNWDDLCNLYKLIRKRKPFTVLEFGVGYSTVVIAAALEKNWSEWDKLTIKPKIRNSQIFKLFSVDTSDYWISKTKERISDNCAGFVNFVYSEVEIGTYQGQICHYYKNLPDIVPDFIYLDGPDPKEVKGEINGLSFQCNERTVMSADLLVMESTFLPGLFILVDGRTNNVRFLKNNFKRSYQFQWDKQGDFSTFELIEDKLGPFNINGFDIY